MLRGVGDPESTVRKGSTGMANYSIVLGSWLVILSIFVAGEKRRKDGRRARERYRGRARFGRWTEPHIGLRAARQYNSASCLKPQLDRKKHGEEAGGNLLPTSHPPPPPPPPPSASPPPPPPPPTPPPPPLHPPPPPPVSAR